MIATANTSTVLSQFARWWMSELIGCIPPAWRSIGNHRSNALDVIVSPERVTFRCRKAGKDVELGEVCLEEASTPATRTLLARVRREINVRRGTIVLRLTPQQVLRRRIVLPGAAAENLREVLTYELDRHTPYQAEDVYFDYQLVDADKQEDRISVFIVVVPRSIVDRATDLMAKWGMTPDRICVLADPTGGDDGIDLLGPSTARYRVGLVQHLAAVMAVLAVTLAAATLYLEFARQARTLAVYQEALEQRRVENRAAEGMRSQLADLLSRTQYIVQQKQGRPLVSALLDEVTRRIPDDTWFSQLRLQADQLVVSGYAPSASALIALLEESPMLSQMRFASPVTFDAKLGLERFNLSGSVDPRGDLP